MRDRHHRRDGSRPGPGAGTGPRAVVACCAALLALAALAGCAPPAADTGGEAPGPALQALLDRRAHAVLHHDTGAFLATVDPGATAFRADQRRVIADLAALPFASFTYRLRRVHAFPLPPSADGTPRLAAEAELGYALRGYDRAPVSSPAYLTFAMRRGHWYLASLTDGDVVGDHTAVQLWDQGPVEVVRGAHSLVLGPGGAARLRPYAELADRAVPVVERAWHGAWAGRAVIEVPGSEEAMAALLDATPQAYQDMAAVTWAEAGGHGTAPADRVIVNPQAYPGLSALGQQVVLTHEITHVATRAATTSRTPRWLSEGFADWVGYGATRLTPRQIARELAADIRAGRAPSQLPSDADFATTSGGLAQAYEGAWLACRMVAQRWGDGALDALYAAAGRQGADAALRHTLGIGPAEFTTRWQAYVRGQLG